MIDLNFHYKPEGLRQIAKAVEPYRLTWLEIDSHSRMPWRQSARSTTTPIGALETIYGRRALKPFLDAQAVDVVIVDPQWNGFMEAIRIASLADLYEVNVAAHDAHGYLSTLMGAHLCAAIPNFRIMEFDVDEVPWAADFVTHPPVIENGEMLVPTGPRLGLRYQRGSHPSASAKERRQCDVAIGFSPPQRRRCMNRFARDV